MTEIITMKLTIPFVLLSINLITSYTYAKEKIQTVQCHISSPNWANELNKVCQLDEFYVYYSDLPNSEHKIPQITDINKNTIPDYVENIALQAKSSRDMFHLAGFRSPLKSPRYQNHATGIAIFLQNMKGNGAAFERAAQHPNIAKDMIQMPCSIALVISNNLDGFPGSWATVSHELFHLYQYSYTQFKNSWYLESLAFWADRSLKRENGSGTRNLPTLPQNPTDFYKQIYKQPYTHIWRRLFLINDTDVLKIPDHMKNRIYIGGQKVFANDEWRGTQFVLKFMQDMEKESNLITQQRDWPEYHWKENDQRLSAWNPIIFGLIQKQLQQPQYDQTEIQFIRTVDLKSIKSE